MVVVCGSGALILAARWLAADTLVLRNGDTVEGELVGADSSSIEFREKGFLGLGQVRRYDREDVRRIEIEYSSRSDRSDRSDRGSERGRGGYGDHERGRQGVARERTVDVAANVAWTDTGIEVRSGQEVTFEASGKITWGPGRRDGPAGESGNHYNAGRPIPRRPGAALIGRVGGGHDFFFIGDDQSPMRMPSSGRLYLGINDDYLQDNSGGFRVTVYY